MWSVLRRVQGVEANAVAPGRVAPATPPTAAMRGGDADGAAAGKLDQFAVNQRTLATHCTRADPKPSDPSVLTTPYGNLVYDKLLRYMRHDSHVMRRKAYGAMLELYAQKTEHVILSLKDDAVAVYVGNLKDEDDEVRAMACQTLQLVAGTPNGQVAILDGGHIPAVLDVLQDTSPAVVAEGLRLCCALHQQHNELRATKELLRHKAVPVYVEKAASPDDDVCAMALAALARACDVKEAYIEILDHRALKPLTDAVATRSDPIVVVEAAECIGKLAFYSAGKRAAVHDRTVVPVIRLLSNEEPVVRTAASGALVALTISEAGKMQAIEAGVVETLTLSLKGEQERDILTNEVKTLCNISEAPAARAELAACIPRLEEIIELCHEEHPTLAVGAKRAIAMIRWQPGDVY